MEQRQNKQKGDREFMWNEIVLSGFADEIDSNLDKQIEVIKKLGMNHIEMRGVNGKGLVEYSLDEVREIKKILDANGIKLSSIGSPIGKIKITDDFEPHFELFQHTVEIAKIMEVPYIRMFSFFMPENEDPAQYKEEVFARLGRFVQYAKEQGVILLHENEKDIYGDIAPRCKEIMEAFYGDNMKAVFDFANFVQCGQNTVEAYEMMKPYIAYVHIKDAKSETSVVVPAGHGDGQIETILGYLKASGYQGFLSLEPHLADFAGFSALESNGAQMKKMPGDESFTLAHDSLVEILNRL